jgi:alpha/beta superfamily hydrolase
MNNKVTHTLARYFVRRGGLAVRFNFRGVGASAGTYDGGDGETDDAAAVIEWVCERHPGVPLYLAGFSFGAMVSIRAAVGRQVAALVTVAPPVRFFRNGFTHPGCPWLVIQGLADEIVPAEAVRAWCETLDPRPALSTVPDADHFFHGALPLLGDAIDEFLDSIEPVRTRTGGTAAC